jgi:hypothetical protein
MASILPFIRNRTEFDDDATRLMGEAFDAACQNLYEAKSPALAREIDPPMLVREIIAKRIIEAAEKGERDLSRLRAAALAALGFDRETG